MNKIKVYLDFDGTVVSSTKRLVEILNVKFNQNEDWTKIKKYNCEDLFPKVTLEQITEIFADKEFFNGLEIFDNCIEILQYYAKFFDYEIVTIGCENNLFWKEKWCNENLPFKFKFNGIQKHGMGKGVDVCDMRDGIIIDDHQDNITTSNAKYKILYRGEFETEWNQIPEGYISDKEFDRESRNTNNFIKGRKFLYVANDWLDISTCFYRILFMEALDE